MDFVFLAYFAYTCASFRRLQPTSDSSLLDLPHFHHSWLPDLHFHSRQQCCKYAAAKITVFLAVTLQFVMLVPTLWKNLLGTAWKMEAVNLNGTFLPSYGSLWSCDVAIVPQLRAYNLGLCMHTSWHWHCVIITGVWTKLWALGCLLLVTEFRWSQCTSAMH